MGVCEGGVCVRCVCVGGGLLPTALFTLHSVPVQVNDINFENMSNDDAVRVLRDIVHKPG